MQLYPFMNPLSITHKHDVIVLTVQNLLNNKKKRNFMRLGWALKIEHPSAIHEKKKNEKT